MSVFKRGGTWYFSKTINGVRHKKALPTARNKAQAEQAEAKAILDIHQGEFGGRRKRTITFNEFIDKTFEPWARANRRSWSGDEGRLKALQKSFGKKRLDEITPFSIEKYKSERRSSTLRPEQVGQPARLRSIASVNRELSLLSRVFTLALVNKETAVNPCRNVKHIPGEQPRTRYLSPEEEARLMEELGKRQPYVRLIVTLALHTGMRRGELLRLRWDQIDFFRNEIKVTQTKTNKDRVVPMNRTVLAILSEMRGKGETREFLFPSPKVAGHLVNIKRQFTAALKNAGIKDFRFHDLRHTFGTRAADSGVEITSIAEVMGHSNILTTKRYSHATDQGRRRVVEAVEQSLRFSVPNRSQAANG